MYNKDTKTVLLGGAEIKDFRIVTPKDANVLETMLANHLALYLKDNYGYTLTVADDTLENEKEILIGNTARTTLSVETNSFAIAFSEGKLQLAMEGLRGFEGIFEYLDNTLLCSDKECSYSDSFTYKGMARNTLDDGSELINTKSGDIRVMFYNVYGWSGHGPNEVRHLLQTEMVKAYAPDVLCLQEYGQHPPHVTYHEGFTPLMKEIGYIDASVETTYINNTPLFYRADKLELINSGCWLYSQPNNANSKSITWAILEVKSTRKRFIAISTHMMYDQPGIDANAARIQNAKEILSVIAEIRADEAFKNLPLVMGGDLNCFVNSDPHKILAADGGLQRAFNVAAIKNDSNNIHNYATWNDDAGVFTQWVPVNGNNSGAIDHAYVSPNTLVKTYATVKTLVPLWTSDHMPLIVEIDI